MDLTFSNRTKNNLSDNFVYSLRNIICILRINILLLISHLLTQFLCYVGVIEISSDKYEIKHPRHHELRNLLYLAQWS